METQESTQAELESSEQAYLRGILLAHLANMLQELQNFETMDAADSAVDLVEGMIEDYARIFLGMTYDEDAEVFTAGGDFASGPDYTTCFTQASPMWVNVAKCPGFGFDRSELRERVEGYQLQADGFDIVGLYLSHLGVDDETLRNTFTARDLAEIGKLPEQAQWLVTVDQDDMSTASRLYNAWRDTARDASETETVKIFAENGIYVEFCGSYAAR